MKIEKWAPAMIVIGLALVGGSYAVPSWTPGAVPDEEFAEEFGRAQVRLHELASNRAPGGSETRYVEQVQQAQQAVQDKMDALESRQRQANLIARVTWWAGTLLATAGVVIYLVVNGS